MQKKCDESAANRRKIHAPGTKRGAKGVKRTGGAHRSRRRGGGCRHRTGTQPRGDARRPHGPRRNAGPDGRGRDARGQILAGVHVVCDGRAVHHVRRSRRVGAGEPRGVGRRRPEEGLPPLLRKRVPS